MSSTQCGNSLIKGTKGQVKIIEGLLTLIIILSALSFLVYFGGVHKTVGTSELEEVGENVLRR